MLLIQALETDLTKLFELAQETISDTYKLVLKSPVGLLQRRRGGEVLCMTILPYIINGLENSILMDFISEELLMFSYLSTE